MPDWTFMLATSTGNSLADLLYGTDRQLTFQRNGIPEAALTISHEDPSAGYLLDAVQAGGMPNLKAYRDGTLRFNGYLAPFTEELEDDAKLHLVFRGPFSRVLGDGQYPGRFTGASVTFTNAEAGDIAVALIDTYAPDVGIDTSPVVPVTKTRTRTYEYANVGESIVALTSVLDGFDFEVAPADSGSTIGTFNVYQSQGEVETDVRFEYGPETLRNVRAVQRQTLPPRNKSRVIGANGLIGTATDALSVTRYGEWWVQEQATDISEQASLNARAEEALRPDPVRIVTFTPDPLLAPAPWDDYWLGDRVQFYARRGNFDEMTTVRVNKITVAIDDEGNEAAQLEGDNVG